MAFLIKNFSPVGANSAKGDVPSQWSYKSDADSKGQMLGANYFNDVVLSLNDNDALTVIGTDGLGYFHVVSADNATGIVVVDDDLSVSIPSSASFINIFEISDFPNQSTAGIILENGINYRVYIDGPVSSDLLFLLDGDYDLGGSMVYLGARGVLKWTHTNGTLSNPLVDGANLSVDTNFRLEGFEFIDGASNTKHAMEFSGVSTAAKGGHIVVKNCKFTGFPEPVNLVDMERIDFEDVIIAPGGTTQTNAALKITTCEFINIFKSTIETKDSQMVLDLDPSEIIRAAFSYVDFVVNHSLGVINIDPTQEPLSGIAQFSNCQSFNGNTVGKGFNVPQDKSGSIRSIVTDSGTITITTFQNHGVTVSDRINLFATLAYDDLNLLVTAVTPTTIDVNKAFVGNNYGGNYSVGSIYQFSSIFVQSYNCQGFLNPEPMIVTETGIVASPAQTTLADVWAPFTFTLGQIFQSSAGLAKDFRLKDYTKNILEYAGLSPALIRVTCDFITIGQATQKDYEFRFAVREAGGTLIKASTPAQFNRSDIVGGFSLWSFDADVFLMATDTVQPEIFQDGGTSSVVITSMIMGARK